MKRHWPLATILAVFAILVLLQIGWGLPGSRRAELMFPGGLTDDVIDEMVIRSRKDLADQADTPIPLVGRAAHGVPAAFDRGEALDACRRFLLYTDNPDEMLAVMALARIKPGEGQFDPGMGQYGGAFLYPLGAWLKAASIAGLVEQRDLGHYLRHSEAMGRIYVAGRAFVALCVGLSLIVVYRIGSRFGGRPAGALAAGLAALCPAVMAWSVVLKPHAAAMLPAMLALDWSLTYFDSRRRRSLVMAALAGGLAVGMTAVAAPILLTVALAAILAERPWRQRFAAVATAAGLAAAGFLVTNPYAVLSFGDRLAEMSHVGEFYDASPSFAQFVGFILLPLRESIGAVFIVLTCFAAAAFVAVEWKRAAVLLAPLVATVSLLPLVLGSWASEPQSARFILPVLPVAALAVAWWVTSWRGGTTRYGLALLVLMAAMAAPTVVAQVGSSRGVNPRYDAAKVLNGWPRLPLVIDYPAAPFRAPPVAYLHRPVTYVAPYSRSYVTAHTQWWPSRSNFAAGRSVLSQNAERPWWLRAPLTFADRDIIIQIHTPGEERY
jgi:dolichyl-phosphate-mannose-protein mannosyltransferase